MEILDFMLELMINSPNNIIYNRGNHEVNDTYRHYGFRTEINTKLRLDIKKFTDYQPNFIEFFTYLPTAVIIHYKDTDLKYIACHGCIPIANTWYFLHINKLNTNNKYIVLEKGTADQFRWNDLNINIQGPNPLKSTGENGTTINRCGRLNKNNCNFYTIPYELLTKFLDHFNLKFLVRGHQDYYANTVLFGKKTYNNVGSFENGTSILNVISDKSNGKTPSKLISNIDIIKEYKPKTGPIARINFQNTQSINYNYKNVLETKDLKDNNIKAITISTNTDAGRILFIDSFMIIFVMNSTTSIPTGPATSILTGPATSIPTGPATSIPTGHATSILTGPATSIPTGHTTSIQAGPATSIPTVPTTSIQAGPASSTSNFSNNTIDTFIKGFEMLDNSVQQIKQKLDTLKQKLDEFKKTMAGGAIQIGGANIKNDITKYKNILTIVNEQALLKDFIAETYKLLTDLWNPENNTDLKTYLNNNPSNEIQQYFINVNGNYYFSDVIFTQIILGKLNSNVYPNSITERNLKKYYNTKFKK